MVKMGATQVGSAVIAKWVLWIPFMLVWGVGEIHAQDEAAAGEDENQRLIGRAIAASRDEKWAEATEMLDALINQGNAPVQAWYWRGRARFCQGNVKEAAKDFDHYYEGAPESRSRQWERGIALYYAGRFEAGAKQFELYQTYHDSDVENATWKYLCEAQTLGPEPAQRRILKIGPDRRIPMRRIYDLYAGEASVEEVFKAVESAKLSEAEKNRALFYAHLYVGLWYESLGKHKEARPHLEKAGTVLPIDHYMGWVGRVHWQLVKGKKTKSSQ